MKADGIEADRAALEGPGLAYDGSELLGRPGFWPAHLGEVLELDLDDELAGLFDERLDAIRSVHRQLTDAAAWPVFPIELGGGGRAAVVYRNFAEDTGVDYLVVPPGGGSCIRFATVEGCGHWIPEERPDWVVERLLEFFGEEMG